MFTSSTATGSNEYEIMVWLAALGGAGPISSTGSPVSTPTINGVSWKLYSGPNGATTVYSFVAASEVTSFSGDMKLFLTYLAANEGFSTSQYVTSIGAGTEPFTGTNAVLTVSAYSIAFNLGSGTGTTTAQATTTTAKSTSTTTSKAASTTGASLYGQCGRFQLLFEFAIFALSANSYQAERVGRARQLARAELVPTAIHGTASVSHERRKKAPKMCYLYIGEEFLYKFSMKKNRLTEHPCMVLDISAYLLAHVAPYFMIGFDKNS
jgi:hypothetical protein